MPASWEQTEAVSRNLLSTPYLKSAKSVWCGSLVSNNKYLNCCSCHQQQTTKSRTLAELYRCKRKAKSRFGCQQVGNKRRQCQGTCRQHRTSTGVQCKTLWMWWRKAKGAIECQKHGNGQQQHHDIRSWWWRLTVANSQCKRWQWCQWMQQQCCLLLVSVFDLWEFAKKSPQYRRKQTLSR